MLDKINLKNIMLKEEYKQEVPPLKQKMGQLQQLFKQAKVPVIVFVEGWGASGKGSLMSDVILYGPPEASTWNPPPRLRRMNAGIPICGGFGKASRQRTMGPL